MSEPFLGAQPRSGPDKPPAGPQHRARRHAGPQRHLPYALVLCGVAAGLGVVATGHFRRGSVLIAAAVFAGALARLLLPERLVGLLAVRRRWVDVLLMTVAAAGITFVAFVAKGS